MPCRPVNNAVYDTYGDLWWDEHATVDFTSLRYCVNPVRYAYFTRVLRRHGPTGKRVLDVGCGGGFLAESFARDGFEVAAIDPSAPSIGAARRHLAVSNLAIDYRVASGERLPFADRSFDVVACCDVLEHVGDVGQVLREAARVLADGGLFLFDTVNRTRRSRFALITAWQHWGLGGLGEADIHVWEKFITPRELNAHLRERSLVLGETRGISARNPLALAWAFYRTRRGLLRNEALAPALGFHESRSLSVSYMGYALKR